jgi:energy-coupling factor transport system substrate-specific component
MTSRLGPLLSLTILAVTTVLGLWAILYPFLQSTGSGESSPPQPQAQAPFTFLVLLALCFVVIVANLETRRMDSKFVAALGVLVAINAVLRLVPGPAGFTAILFLPILCGYAYGADFGFLLGALSFLVSAIITGGLGPWLHYQMFSTGWMGMTSAFLPDLRRLGRVEVVPLALWGAVLGLVFGVIMNLWFWPYLADAGQPSASWEPGMRAGETVGRYVIFYVTTSLWWDMGRAVGNLVLILLFGASVLRLLRRYQRRFQFVTQ